MKALFYFQSSEGVKVVVVGVVVDSSSYFFSLFLSSGAHPDLAMLCW